MVKNYNMELLIEALEKAEKDFKIQNWKEIEKLYNSINFIELENYLGKEILEKVCQ